MYFDDQALLLSGTGLSRRGRAAKRIDEFTGLFRKTRPGRMCLIAQRAQRLIHTRQVALAREQVGVPHRAQRRVVIDEIRQMRALQGDNREMRGVQRPQHTTGLVGAPHIGACALQKGVAQRLGQWRWQRSELSCALQAIIEERGDLMPLGRADHGRPLWRGDRSDGSAIHGLLAEQREQALCDRSSLPAEDQSRPAIECVARGDPRDASLLKAGRAVTRDPAGRAHLRAVERDA